MLNFKNQHQHHIYTLIIKAGTILVAMEILKKATVILVTEFSVLILN